MEATIEVTGLRKRFGPTLALDGMTFTVLPGQVTGFVGPNGAGKTTTMRVILGLDAADEGTALVGGQPYRTLRHPLSQVGALLDAGALQPGRSARNHLLWLAHSQGLGDKRVDEVVEQAGLRSVIRRKAGGYSLGMRQRLGIAAALLGDPPVLMMDEPFNGMDPEGIVWMRGFLRALAAEGRAVLVSSHLMSELEDAADHLVVIGRGQVIADASVRDMIVAASGDLVELRTAARDEAMTVLANAGAEVDRDRARCPHGQRPFRRTDRGGTHCQPCPLHRGRRPPGDSRGGLHGAHPRRGGIPRRPGGRRSGAMTTVLPYRSTARDARDGFGQLLHAEWTKFRTVRGWVVGMILAVLVTAGLGVFVAKSGVPSCASQTSSGQQGPVQHGAACGQPIYTLGPGGVPVQDEFYFVRQPLAGNGSITVQVTSLTGLAQ